MKRIVWVLLVVLMGANAFAEDIEVPEDELARETTLPVFNKRRAVLNRNVNEMERIEIGLGPGLEMNEPYYNDYMFGLQGTYNMSETSAINVQGLYWMSGLSNYGEQLKAGKYNAGTSNFNPFDATKAPHPQWGLFANYEYVAYYGKISISKQGVMNLNLFGLAGIGYINMGSVGVPALNLGVGQNFFITNNIGIRADLRWLIFSGPNPASQPLSPTAAAPSASSFGNRIFYNSQLGLSLVFIL